MPNRTNHQQKSEKIPQKQEYRSTSMVSPTPTAGQILGCGLLSLHEGARRLFLMCALAALQPNTCKKEGRKKLFFFKKEAASLLFRRVASKHVISHKNVWKWILNSLFRQQQQASNHSLFASNQVACAIAHGCHFPKKKMLKVCRNFCGFYQNRVSFERAKSEFNVRFFQNSTHPTGFVSKTDNWKQIFQLFCYNINSIMQ